MPMHHAHRLRRVALGLGLTVVLAVVAACRPSVEPPPAGVVVTIPPLRGLIEPLLPPGTPVTVLVRPGVSVHGYEPTPDDIVALRLAGVVITVGLGLEIGVQDAVRHGGSTASLLSMAETLGIRADAHHHRHEDHSDPQHEHALDPHLWLDPVLARDFVLALPPLLPAEMQAHAAAAAPSLAARLDEVHAQYAQRLAPFAGRAIVTHHASFGRAAERYGFEIAAVIRPVETAEPSPVEIAEARRAIAEHGVGAIFIEPQFAGGPAERLAEIAGARLIVLDPLGDGGWIDLMERNLDALVEGLSATAATPSPPP